ncbi:MAG TPA: hypothetical protein VM076_17070, partial [Gemmatimonadaceae bacterium]|nr:hypothetical protein [Gemmatimonadaceae bacterium]
GEPAHDQGDVLAADEPRLSVHGRGVTGAERGEPGRVRQSPSSTIARLTWAIVALGIVLRVVAYARRSTLWLDESAVARNIVERSFADLMLVPLDYGQAAPRGFLLLEWLSAKALGTSDLAFRLVPFLTGVASLFLFAAIARRLLSPAGALAALVFFVSGYWFLVYSSDLHPYGLDLALSLGAWLLVLQWRESGYARDGIWRVAVFGAVAVWFSNGTLLTLFGLGAALGAVMWRERGLGAAVRSLAPIAVAWGVSAAGAALVAKRMVFPTTAEYLDAIWGWAMVPLPRSLDSALWLWRAWRMELATMHGWSIDDPAWTSLYPALALIGSVALLRRRTADAVIAGSVVVAYVLVSMARQYPYDSRLVLMPMAILLLGVGEALGTLAAASWGRARVVGKSLAVLLCVPPIYRVAAFPPPYQWSVMGSYLAQIRERWQPGDVLYASYGRAMEVLYQAPKFGLTERDMVLGACNQEDPRAVLRTVDALRGRKRAWVVVGPGMFAPLSQEYAYLRTIGVRRDSLGVMLPGSIRQGPAQPFDIPTAYLFDLSDPVRLARATADSYVLSRLTQRELGRANRWNCYGVFVPTVRQSEAVIPSGAP